jgi:hypothetical protein
MLHLGCFHGCNWVCFYGGNWLVAIGLFTELQLDLFFQLHPSGVHFDRLQLGWTGGAHRRCACAYFRLNQAQINTPSVRIWSAYKKIKGVHEWYMYSLLVPICWRKISTSHQAHNKPNKAGLTHVPESEVFQSIFLKLTKDEKQLDKTWNLPGGTRQFRIYGYKANQNDI